MLVETIKSNRNQKGFFSTRWGREAGFYKQLDRQTYDSLKLADYVESMTNQMMGAYLELIERAKDEESKRLVFSN